MLTFPALCRLEWRRVRRDRTLAVSAAGLTVVLIVALVVSRAVDVEATAARLALRSAASRDEAAVRQQLASADRLREPVRSYSLGETAILPSRPLSWLSLGAADFQPTVARLAVYSDPLALFDEPGGTRSPAVLAAGRLDVAFVLVWLLPLAVIGTTFGVLSTDRESGVLPMTLSQPVTLRRVSSAVVATRAGTLAAIVIGIVGAAGLVLGPVSAASVRDLGLVSGAIASYVGVWAALSRLVNFAGWSSATNAFALGVTWLTMVGLMPPAVTSVASIAAPVDRAGVAARAQEAYAAAAASGSRLIDEYYAAHPTFDPAVSQGIDVPMREFWAVLDRRATETAPAIAEYERRRAWRTRLAALVQVVTPPVALQRVLDLVAGADDERLFTFADQVRVHFQQRQARLVPWLFQSHALTLDDVDALPRLEFHDPPHVAAVLLSVGAMTMLAVVLWMSASSIDRRRASRRG